MKPKILFSALLILSFTICSAQTEIESIIKKGIELHDAGKFDEAIDTYFQALELDSTSALAHYELSLSYMSKGDYENTIKYADLVLNESKEFQLSALVNKGSALDMLGKTDESIELFTMAINSFEPHYLIHYNLALNYIKLDSLSKAEEHAKQAIELNSSHSTSHLLLANVYDARNKPVQTILACNYFLFMEPSSNRSLAAFEQLQHQLNGKVRKSKDKPRTTLIEFSGDEEDPFSAAELMISMMVASDNLDKKVALSKEQIFIKNNSGLITTAANILKEKDPENWWNFYTVFLNDIATSEHKETYCRYISRSAFESSEKWLIENEEKLIAFGDWLEKYE